MDAYKAFLLELLRGTLTEAEAARIRGTESREVLETPLPEFYWPIPRRVELDVIESFSGPAGKRFVLYSGLGGGDFGVGFKPGQEYLVFAYRAEQSGRWVANICGGTRHIRFAAEDVKTLAALKRGQTLPPRVYGWVTGRPLDKQGYHGAERGLTGAQLRLYSNGFERRTVSHSDGRFRFDPVPPGHYRVQVSLPGWQLLNASPGDQEVDLSPTGCAEMPIMLDPAPKSKK
jgi:hypothetical protein